MAEKVDTDDAVTYADMARVEALMNEKAAAIFKLCDRENKGFLTKTDMRRLETELPLTAEQLEQVFDSLDGNRNGFLTQLEFASGFGMGRPLPLTVGSILGQLSLSSFWVGK